MNHTQMKLANRVCRACDGKGSRVGSLAGITIRCSECEGTGILNEAMQRRRAVEMTRTQDEASRWRSISNWLLWLGGGKAVAGLCWAIYGSVRGTIMLIFGIVVFVAGLVVRSRSE